MSTLTQAQAEAVAARTARLADKLGGTVVRALDDFYAHEGDITAASCRNNAQRFATPRFDAGISEVLGLTGVRSDAVQATAIGA